MRHWEVRKAATADALVEAMNNGNCITEEQAEAIAAQYGDEIRWRSEINLPNIPIAFPVTEKDFLSYQELLSGCKLTPDVRETIAPRCPS